MSRETQEWLDRNVLVGFTTERGNAWHHREGTDNHYPGAIPVADVQRRLFSWEPVATILPCECPDAETCKGEIKIVTRSDNGHRMGVFAQGYQPHDYNEWLLQQVSYILGDTLQVGSAGLLQGGAIAWVSVEVPDTITTPEGVAFRPHLLATTSFNGKVATTYKRVVTRVVCDNTRDMAMSEDGQQYKVKHTSNSDLRLTEARDALAMVHTIADDFQAEVKALCETTVTDAQWFRFLDLYAPPATEDATQRSRTMADNRRDALTAMYRTDPRASDWRGTAFGVLQAVDTYTQHVQTVKGAQRAERNMLNVIQGKFRDNEAEASTMLSAVLVG